MNQQFGTGPRGNRGGRGHYHQGRFQHRFPQQNFKNPNYNQNNNNNSQKCYNQNVEQCSNPNMDQGEYHPHVDRTFGNASGNLSYLGNDPPAYSIEPPMYHSHQPPLLFDMQQFPQQQFAEMSMTPQMVPQMQLLNYPQPPYLPQSLVYSVFPPAGMPQSQPESFNPMKDGSTRSHSRESFHEADLADCRPMAVTDYGTQQPQNCAICAGKDLQSAAKIHELETENETLRTKNRALKEEIVTLKEELQVGFEKKDLSMVSANSTDIKAGLSVTAQPFVAKITTGGENCARGGGQMWPPDAVDQGFEKRCTELIEIIEDRPEDAWSSPDVAPVKPVLPPTVIPVVSANARWSEMIDTETEMSAEGAGGFKGRGRGQPEEQTRPSDRQDPLGGRGRVFYDSQAGHGHGPGPGHGHQDQGYRGTGYQDNRAGRNPSYQGNQTSFPGLNEQGTGRGSSRRHDNRRNQDQRGPPFQTHGLNSTMPPDPNGGFHQGRSPSGPNFNRGGQQNRNFQGQSRPYGPQSRHDGTNWRKDNHSNRPSGNTEGKVPTGKDRDRNVSGDRKGGDEMGGDVVTDSCVKASAEEVIKAEEVKVDEKTVEELKLNEKKTETRAESRERPDRGRSDSYQKGGSGDRQRSQEGAAESEPRQVPKASVITEKDGDLFTADDSFSLAHCVAVDLQMGSGIAVTFRDNFKRVAELLDQRKNVGQVAILSDKSRFIYYLITKERSHGKPTMNSLGKSLWEMAKHCRANEVKRLAMPRIGCGLDRLNWVEVKALIMQVFTGSGVEITVYNYPQHDDRKDEFATQRKKSSLYVVQKLMKLFDIEKGTGFIYFCAEDNSVTPSMESLDGKHHFLPSFQAAKRVCGDIVETTRGNEVFYGMVVKKTGKDRLSYGHLLSCLKKLRTKNNVACFEYFGIEAFRDGGDELTMHKVITVIRNVFGGSKYKVEFWVCFPEQFAKDMDVPLPSST